MASTTALSKSVSATGPSKQTVADPATVPVHANAQSWGNRDACGPPPASNVSTSRKSRCESARARGSRAARPPRRGWRRARARRHGGRSRLGATRWPTSHRRHRTWRPVETLITRARRRCPTTLPARLLPLLWARSRGRERLRPHPTPGPLLPSADHGRLRRQTLADGPPPLRMHARVAPTASMDTTDLTAGPGDGATKERSYSVDDVRDLSPGDMIRVHRESSMSKGGGWRLYDHYAIFLGHDCRDHGLRGGPAVLHYCMLRHCGSRHRVDGAIPRTCVVPHCEASSCLSWLLQGVHKPRAVAAQALTHGSGGCGRS